MSTRVKKDRIKQNKIKKEEEKKKQDEYRICLFNHLERVKDGRKDKGKMYRLLDILVLTIYGVLWGFTDFTNMVDELEYHEEYFKSLLSLKYGIPSHDTFSYAFSLLDVESFIYEFAFWINEIVSPQGEHLAIDGKAIRAACRKIDNEEVPYILNAMLTESGIVISQMKIGKKKNEISTIPEFLDCLNIKNSIITIDAIGTQIKIVDKISSCGGEFILPVKLNQKELNSDILSYFESEIEDRNVECIESSLSEDKKTSKEGATVKYCREFDAEHGREEERKYYYSEDISFLSSLHPKWYKRIKAIGLIIRKRKIVKSEKGKEKTKKKKELIDKEEIAYSVEYIPYILSSTFGILEFKKISREHWEIEMMHYKLDTTMKEDLSTIRKGNGMENMSLMRKLCYNLMILDDDENVKKKKTIKKKQNYYRHHTESVEHLLFSILPSMIKEGIPVFGDLKTL